MPVVVTCDDLGTGDEADGRIVHAFKHRLITRASLTVNLGAISEHRAATVLQLVTRHSDR